MKINTQLLSENVGQQIINTDNVNIDDLDKKEGQTQYLPLKIIQIKLFY